MAWRRLPVGSPVPVRAILRRDVVTGWFILALLINTVLVIVYSIGANPTQNIRECIVAVLACEALTLIMMGGEMAAAYK